METLIIALVAGLAFIVAYHTYGRWLGGRIFRLTADRICPSHKLRDDNDYVPTPKSVVFGHHFTSIAGTGPIVGPAIAVMWGWVPALLWVVFGSIFIGAVHDLGALVVSLRNQGQTVGEIAGRLIGKRVRLLFLVVLFMALTIVLAIFGLVIANVFRLYPSSILPCLLQIPIAVGIGAWLHRKGASLLIPSLLALAAMYLTVIYGDWGPLHATNAWLADRPVMDWVAFLLVYSYVASVLPVWLLLQPRDYINSLQLVSALGLIVLGLCVAAFFGGAADAQGVRQPLEVVAPAVQWNPQGAPAMFPFLFITIACGAISGFHCLVSSGTSSKQLSTEPDARFVGYGAMLTEGFLATLVILACVAGIGLGATQTGADGSATMLHGEAAWTARYASWQAAGGLGATVGSFVDGAANFLAAIGIGRATGVALMGVLVASFAGTTLDTACRLQRYVIEELAGTLMTDEQTHRDRTAALTAHPLSWLRNKHGATIFAVLLAGGMAAMPIDDAPWTWAGSGKGALMLWPLFGATNQLLGGLSFLVISFYLWRRKLPVWFLIAPMTLMLILPAWAMVEELPGWLRDGKYVLGGIAMATLLIEAWMIVEALLLWPKVRGVLESTGEEHQDADAAVVPVPVAVTSAAD